MRSALERVIRIGTSGTFGWAVGTEISGRGWLDTDSEKKTMYSI